MNIFEFLIYWMDKHPIIFGTVSIILAFGVSGMLSNLFYNKHKAESDKEQEKQFWK